MKKQSPAAEDVVFFPTMSEFDFEALREYWNDDPICNQPSWHIQFHYDGFHEDGAVAHVPSENRGYGPERVHFYSVTDELAQQYRQFMQIPVRCLAWPVNPLIHPEVKRTASVEPRPVKAVVAGEVR